MNHDDYDCVGSFWLQMIPIPANGVRRNQKLPLEPYQILRKPLKSIRCTYILPGLRLLEHNQVDGTSNSDLEIATYLLTLSLVPINAIDKQLL